MINYPEFPMLRPLLYTMTLAGVMLASPSFGHAKLVNSFPASGAQIMEPPKTLTLSFNEAVKLASLTLTLAGKALPVTVDKAAPAAKTVVVPVPALAPGSYEVRWTAISTDDGHVTKGSFAFTVSGSMTSH
jgi:methionine-rich copper-binding protein CopC